MGGISSISGSAGGFYHPQSLPGAVNSQNGDSGQNAHASQAGEIALPGDIHAAKNAKDTGAQSGFGGQSDGRPKRPDELSKEEEAQVSELRRVDAKVRAHEMAHLAASGGFATSGAKFEYTVGPDGKSYAVAGEVGIDTSPVKDDPQATIAKARTIRGAALAPADPSGADRAVAAAAAQMEAEAAQQLARRRETENMGGEGDASEGVPTNADRTDSARAASSRDEPAREKSDSRPTAYGIPEPDRPGAVFDLTG